MKKLITALCFVMVLAFAASAWATVIDVNYYWPSGGQAMQSGDLAKVEEYWIAGDQRPSGPYPYVGLFRYDVTSLTVPQVSFYYFAINNPASVGAVATDSSVGGVAWVAAHTSDKWVWYTTDISKGIDGNNGYFYIYTDAPRGIVTGALSTSSTGSPITTSGPVSGPVPEPSSMLLLGMGLFGFAGKVVRRKKV